MMKTAIVTGAGKGIGLAIAQLLADNDYFVIIADVDKEAGQSAVELIGKDNSTFIYCDVSDEQSVQSLFAMAVSQFGKENIYLIVNNAGLIRDRMIWKMPAEDFDKVIGVNLKGSWLMCREAASIMRENKKGRIVNIASRAWMGNPGQTNYSASKAGVIGLTRSLSLELGRYGVTVNAIAPGLIDTPLTQALPEDVLQKLINAQPTRTMGSPIDIAEMVVYLASEKTGFITGQVFHIDGGKSVGSVVI
jgi:NAD(P)-dependent dehydrogenase (short-subunit alcohol dehydrogenase family)